MAKARPIPGLHPETPFVDAATMTLAVRTGELFADAGRLLDVTDAGAVHDTRVASRRLRAVLDLYAPVFAKRELRSVRREVKHFAQALGARRDPDVALASLEAISAAVAPADRPGVDAFAAILRDERAAANAVLAEALEHAQDIDLAGRLRGLRPRTKTRRAVAGTLSEHAAEAIEEQLITLVELGDEAAARPTPDALHDARLAAKRLRYLLDLSDGCFGPFARTASHRARALQDVLGAVHDCDVALPRVQERLAELQAADVEVLRARAGNASDVHPSLSANAPHAEAWRGLVTLSVHVQARRGLLIARWNELWSDLHTERVAARLREALAQRPSASEAPMTSSSHVGGDALVASARSPQSTTT